jgi:predicted O-methyltransferase YrrM
VEPTSAESVAQWIQTAQRQRDAFEHVRLASHEHRESHGAGCSVYPTSSGPLLSVLAAAVAAGRILEVGSGLGYSALCLAHGSSGVVETIERDADHARLAEEAIVREGYGDRIRVLRGRGADVLPLLDEPYDLISPTAIQRNCRRTSTISCGYYGPEDCFSVRISSSLGSFPI